MAVRGPSLRERLNAFVARHELAWELVMGSLALATVILGFASDTTGPSASGWLIAEWVLVLVMAVEFGTRLGIAHDRRRHLRRHWVDAFAILPAIRGLRWLRVLRLLGLVRLFASAYRALSGLERLARHRSLVWLMCAWLAVAGICSAALWVAESGVNPNVNSPDDALWWGIVTLSTVGYGDVTPITPEGRIAASVLMLLGIALFATITGTVTSYLLTSNRSSPPAESVADRLRDLHQLHDEGVVDDSEYAEKKSELLARM